MSVVGRAIAPQLCGHGFRRPAFEPLARKPGLLWRPRQVLDARLQPTTCRSRAAMSGWPRPGGWHEGRVLAGRPVSPADEPPGGCPRRIRGRGRLGATCRGARRHPPEHSQTPPRRPSRPIRADNRAVDLPRSSRGVACRAWSGTRSSPAARLARREMSQVVESVEQLAHQAGLRCCRHCPMPRDLPDSARASFGAECSRGGSSDVT